ncbi:MAG: pyridoxal-phosphate dependent enzyme [candidate division KSB1 bacterium]|nr:pyridoxal-phosphate dependent enzyme [candidate division KSB1 bacterium]MDZ7304824.1 pyridoxal-phosphate dependent enzyme [candidate division KSB1 bacterium]MDZ7313904.1 pyridoxal-phosphate dependent enzyme [candidate division KSB1 bacterium]
MKQNVCANIVDAIGYTPLVRLNRVTAGIKAAVHAKVEYLNPGGSIKDRIAIAMVEDAVSSGKLKPGGTIVNASSGNTGAGLAMVAAVKGYRTIFTMPDKTSPEKVRTLKAYGAEVILCPTAVPPDSPESYHRVAEKVVKETPNAILLNQYFNPLNPETHYRTTGPEIWEQTNGKIDYFVCGIDSGGCISGTGKYLKEKNPDLKVIGADPVGSALREHFYTRKLIPTQPYKVEGIGQEIIPGTLQWEYVDEVHSVGDKESFLMARRLAREEGLLVGGSSGTAVMIALQIARDLPAGKTMVVILADSGMYYLSKFYNDEWMRENRYQDIENALVHHLLEAKHKGLPALISVPPTSTVREALHTMEANNISQVPVIEDGHSIGSLEESALMGRVLEDASLLDTTVRTVMEQSFPIIQYDDTMEHTKYLLARRYPAILVQEHGKLVGIITKADLIDFIA